jgi:hypothetical protein
VPANWRLRRALVLALPVAGPLVLASIAGCGLTGPSDPERSIVGTYRGEWAFGIYDPDTIARGDDPPDVQSRGWIHCPGEFQVTEQDGKDISGRFELQPRAQMSCTSRQEGFCSEALAAKFCRQVTGTIDGEAFSTGSPEARTILFEFHMRVEQSAGRAALGQFIGCSVVAQEKDVFTGGVRDDMDATASMSATAECAGQAGLDRVDVAILLRAGRVAGP